MNVDHFISENVTFRSRSMFLEDIEQNKGKLAEHILGRSLLVIGGAGSIGSSFIKAVLPFRPKCLVVVDINENALTELTRDLRSSKGIFVPEDYVSYPMDYSSPIFAKMFRARKGFDIVANFSAHKHVRSEKDIFSIEALIQNNLLKAKALLDVLSEYPPLEYFCVSTDKAANPVNIMGASKRIMEDLIFAYSDKFPVKTARFANVAFSNGSLPAGFLERMNKLQPISAPNDVKRYFVSLEESGQICMLACVLGQNRSIFFPKLQKERMISFDMIATNLLKSAGYEVEECNSEAEAIGKAELLKSGGNQYPVYYSASDTSGEKPFEEFYTDEETTDLEKFKALGVIVSKPICDSERLNMVLTQLEDAFQKRDVNKSDIVNILSNYLSNFKHIETGKILDSKM